MLAKSNCKTYKDVVDQLTDKLSKKGIVSKTDATDAFWISCGIDLIDDQDSWKLFSKSNQLFNIILHKRVIDKHRPQTPEYSPKQATNDPNTVLNLNTSAAASMPVNPQQVE